MTVVYPTFRDPVADAYREILAITKRDKLSRCEALAILEVVKQDLTTEILEAMHENA